MQVVLTIAGSDPSGGAGVQADLKTFAAHGVYGTSALTAVTVQNTLGVDAVVPLAPDLVSAQIDAVVEDLGASATKIGMLASAETVRCVADAVRRHRLANVVLDPVMAASSGAQLLDQSGLDVLRSVLLPLATVVTPNTAEAAALVAGRPLETTADQRRAAAAIVGLGAGAAIVTGGPVDGPAVDVLYDGRAFLELASARIPTRQTHGTGCTFASALAARLALGDELAAAFRRAKRYVTLAIRRAPALGHGHGPLNHFVDIWSDDADA